MSKPSRVGHAGRVAFALAAFAAVLLAVAPASADHKRYRGRHYRGHHPGVSVVVGLPPIPIPLPFFPVPYRSYDRYEDDYYDGYRHDGYRRHRHHHHDDYCERGCRYDDCDY